MKKLMITGCLAATVVTAGLTGCKTEDRSAGRYMDDRLVARRVEGSLKHDQVYKYPDVKVNVFEGVAQLSGFVDSPQQVANAADHAARTEGVREVINDIALKPQFKIVPVGPQSGRRYDRNTGNASVDAGVSSGTSSGNAPEYNGYNRNNSSQRAPIINNQNNNSGNYNTLKDKDNSNKDNKDNTSNQ